MQQNSAPAQHITGTRQIQTLIVEPETEARQLLELALAVRGQHVVAHLDAALARDALREATFQIIVISRVLPDSDALQFVREVRGTDSGSSQATIVVISNTPTPDDRAELLAAGADDYIPWPADTDLLRERFDAAEQRALSGMTTSQPGGTFATELFLVLNADATIRRAGPGAEDALGYPADALINVNGFSFFHSDDASTMLTMIVQAFSQPDGSKAHVVRVRRDVDTWHTITLTAINTIDDSATSGLALYLHAPETRTDGVDSTMRATLHDAVTDLPNRTLFLDRIDHAVARAARKALPVVVVTVDFNEFAGIAAVSDGLIVALAQRLRSCLRTSDTAARLGHDEFGLLLEEIVDPENIRIVAEHVIESMQIPFYEEGTDVVVTPNIGIVVSSTTRYRAVALLRDSTTARTWARVQGSGQYVMFDESMSGIPNPEFTDSSSTLELTGTMHPASRSSSIPEDSTALGSVPVGARFDALQDRLDVLEQLIRGLQPK